MRRTFVALASNDRRGDRSDMRLRQAMAAQHGMGQIRDLLQRQRDAFVRAHAFIAHAAALKIDMPPPS